MPLPFAHFGMSYVQTNYWSIVM